MSRPKVLIIGSDFPAFHIFWGDFSRQKIDIIRFIYVPPSYSIYEKNIYDPNDIPNIIIHKGKNSDIEISHLNDLENIINAEKIERCIILTQNIPMIYIASIVNRIMATGSCGIEFFQPKEVYVTSSKPIITVSSLNNEVGKTQLCRYCIGYLSQYRNISVIIPLVHPEKKILKLIGKSKQKKFGKKKNQQSNQNKKENLFSLYQSCNLPHFEFSNYDEALQQKELLSKKMLQEIEDYFKCGAFCIYVSADINRALIQAERCAHIIIYDSYQSEIPLIKTEHQICVATIDNFKNIINNVRWPGLVNLHRSKKIVIVKRGPGMIDDETRLDFIKLLEEKNAKEKKVTLKDAPNSSSNLSSQIPTNLKMTVPTTNQISKEDKRKLFFVNSISENDSVEENISIGISYDSQNFISDSNTFNSNSNFNDSNINSTSSTTSNPNDRKLYKATIISVSQDIVETDSNIPNANVFPKIYEYKNAMHSWLSRFFITLFKPPLQSHFEAQVGILSSMASSSDKELRISNHTSANRGALCRLFLTSHLPPGYRVTNGEILDAHGNYTGQLDVVIVNDSAPYMTIGATNSVIAPILADTVLGVIEVKALMDPDNLKKALSQLRPVKSLMPMHETLETTDGTVVEDPLRGKIITGVFAFNLSKDSLDTEIPRIIKLYPKVADFVVIPGKFGYFLIDTLRVCGIEINERNSDIINDYVRYDADGIGLGLIFGILNTIAAKRRFNGSNFVRYLSGKWEDQFESNKDVYRYMDYSYFEVFRK